eukprot:4089033-Pyramimonas_sp.AAC.1
MHKGTAWTSVVDDWERNATFWEQMLNERVDLLNKPVAEISATHLVAMQACLLELPNVRGSADSLFSGLKSTP